MGGFNLGELAGVLRLDDGPYQQALADSASASALFTVKVNEIGSSVQKLDQQLRGAGFSLKEVQGYLNSLRRQGLSTNEAVETLAGTIGKLQAKIQQLRSSGGVSLTQNQRVSADQSRGETTEPFKAQLDALTLRANVESSFDQDSSRRQTEMFQRSISEALEQERIEKQIAENRKQVDIGAAARQKEYFDQLHGDAAAQLRFTQEAENDRLRIIRESQAKERQQFLEHRRQLQTAAAATTIGLTVGAVGAAGVGAGLFVAKDAAQFQDSMAKSLAVIGDISDQMRDRLSQAARDAAKDTGLAAKDIASDYAIAAKGGLDAADSLMMIPKAARFAVATNSDLHESTKQIVTIMEALQLPASASSKVMDELTVANQLARGSVDQLATSLEGKAGAALRSAHVGLEEALALTVAFSRSGVTASQSQTFLSQVIERLTYAARQYGTEIVQVGDKQMKFHDIVYLSDGSVRPFIQTLKLLDEAFQGRSAGAIGKFFDDIHLGSARGAQALKILLSQSDVLDTLTAKFGETGGAVNKAFDQQMQSPLRQLDVLKAKLTDVAITIGIPTVAALQSATTALKPVLDAVQSLAAKFANLPQPAQETIVSLLGMGSASLVAGGGLLVLTGHIIRLTADLNLLLASGALGGVAVTLSTIAAAAAAATVTVAGVIAAFGTYDKIKSGEFTIGPNGFPSPNPRYVPPQKSTTNSASDPAKQGAEAGKSFMDGLRKQLEDLKGVWKNLLNPENFAVNPETELKKALKIEDIRQKFVEFSDQYNQLVERLTDQEQDVISSGAQRVGKLLANGADPRVILKALTSLEDDMRRFKSDAAQRDKDDAIRFVQDSAAAQVQAFKERYVADLRSFTESEKQFIQSSIGALESESAGGAKPKQISEDLKLVELAYKAIQQSIDDVEKTQRKLDSTLKKSDVLDRRDQKQKPAFPALADRIDPALMRTIESVGPLVEQGTKVENAMRSMGLTSQFALDLAAKSSIGLYKELQTLNPSVDELNTAFLAMRQKEIQAEEALKPLGVEFTRIRMEMETIATQGNITDRIIDLTNLQIKTQALNYATNGLGIAYQDLWKSFSSSFGKIGDTLAQSIVDVSNFSKIWRDAIKSIAQSLLGVFLGALLKIAASKILVALGIKLDDPQVAAHVKNTVSLDANSRATQDNTDSIIDNTTSEDDNTEALRELTAALRNQADANGGPGGFFKGLVGGLFGAGLAALTGGASAAAAGWMPKLDGGGSILRTGMAVVHAGEFMLSNAMLQSLRSPIAAGGGGAVFDFSGATFGPNLTKSDVESIMMNTVVRKLALGGKKI